jgi:hypothetical protein
MSIIGKTTNGTRNIVVLDDMGGERIAVEVTGGRIGLNQAELEQMVAHCHTAIALLAERAVPAAREGR